MNPDINAKLQRAVALHSQGAAAQAARLYEEVLQAEPRHADALHLLGVAETQLGRAQRGLELIEEALAINPNQPVAMTNRGNTLVALNKPEEALASYDRALRLLPDYALAHHGRGNALRQLRRVEAAIASYDQALRLNPNFVQALFSRGTAHAEQSQYAAALRDHDRAIGLSPGFAQAHFGRGCALLGQELAHDALRSFEQALMIDSGCAEAIVGRGQALLELRRLDEAIAAYDQVLVLNPCLSAALFGRGIALLGAERHDEAATSLRRLIQIEPGYDQALGACLHAQMHVCDWTDYSQSVGEIIAAVDGNIRVDFLGAFLAVCDSPRRQLHWARLLADKYRSKPPPLWTGERYGHDRIRIAYVSADFLEHPTSYLMAGLFEKHDRQRFETIAIALRDDERSPMAQRLRAAFEHFIVVGSRSDVEIARQMRELEVDIAVDLMGYTAQHRTHIFAHRPAPIQVNYLGYPGTMGTGDMDYIIGDEFLIPNEHRADYAEQVVYLPECFHATDDQRPKATDAPTRSAMGLPDSGFVWSAFLSSYKINPLLFDVWARLLCALPDSVLWLVGGNRVLEHNLRRESAARGVDPQRLVFARRLPYSQHLARLPLADLCLDALPYNGGATTSDALWAGVPVVTCAGESFAGRMSGSLLRALQMPELITETLEHYEQLALALARTPHRLAELRNTLSRNATTSPLFNTDRFRRHLESAFATMVKRSESKEPPMGFTVARLPP